MGWGKGPKVGAFGAKATTRAFRRVWFRLLTRGAGAGGMGARRIFGEGG